MFVCVCCMTILTSNIINIHTLVNYYFLSSSQYVEENRLPQTEISISTTFESTQFLVYYHNSVWLGEKVESLALFYFSKER